MLNDDWSFATRRGERIERITATTPCHKCPKIPRGEKPCPANAVELSERSWQAYWHYLECKAVGQWPDDPIVRRNARIIRGVEDRAGQGRLDRALNLVVAMLGGKSRGRT